MLKFDDRITFENKKNDILAIGELLIDMISAEYGDSFEGSTFNKFFGGSPANIAMNVKKLGLNSIVAAAVGNDGLGKYLIDHVHSAGLDTKYIQQVDQSTSMVIISKSKGTPVPIFYRGADYQFAYTRELGEAVKSSKILHLSCWAISRTPIRETVQTVVETARNNNTLICFDPNYHPMIWEKGENGIEYVKSFIGNVDIVKPSEDDAERLFGKDTYENHINNFIKLGTKLVIMTLGNEGAIVSNGKETVRFKSLASEIADTTGAGDAFWSGFYAAIIKGHTFREALNLGFAVSAYKLKYVGAVVDLPKLEVIKSMYCL